MSISMRKLVWSYLKAKPLNTTLNLFLLALGISVVTILILFSNQLQEKVNDNTKGIDLVVGAKGSPLQLILCSVFHIDFPTGNIKLSEADRLASNRLVKYAIPLALGDSYKGFRIVGTTRSYPELYQATLKNGAWWSKDMEIVLGAQVAETLKLKTGDVFESTHGLAAEGQAHEESHFIVTGVMNKANNVLDNLMLTSVPAIWKVHEEAEHYEKSHADTVVVTSKLLGNLTRSDSAREITSLLIKYRNPVAAIQLPRMINTYTKMQAASPAFESARLFTILGAGVSAMQGFAYVLIFVSALSIFLALYNSLKERQYDLAIMRSMGATRLRLFSTVIMEGLFLTIIGGIAGVAIGHGILYVFTNVVEEGARTGLNAWVFYNEEIFIFVGSILLGLICALIPALQAYRTDIHKVLANN